MAEIQARETERQAEALAVDDLTQRYPVLMDITRTELVDMIKAGTAETYAKEFYEARHPLQSEVEPEPEPVTESQSRQWLIEHGYVEHSGRWWDRISLNVHLARLEAIEAEHRWREAQALPPHIAEARIPMKARRMKQEATPLPFE